MLHRCERGSPRCASAWATLHEPPAHRERALRNRKEKQDMTGTNKMRTSGTVCARWSARKFVAACALGALLLCAPKPARAGKLGSDIIALFPKEVGEFAYADLKKARTMKWF